MAQTAPAARDVRSPADPDHLPEPQRLPGRRRDYVRQKRPRPAFPARGRYLHHPGARRVLPGRRRSTSTWPPPGNQPRVPPSDAQGNPVTVNLLPGPAYPLPDTTTARLQLGPTIVRGSLFTASGDPIRDVVVEVVNLPLPEPAGAAPAGAVAVPEVHDQRPRRLGGGAPRPALHRQHRRRSAAPGTITKQITFNVQYVPNSPPTAYTRTFALGREHSLRNTALRGQVVGPGGRPIGGAQITTSVGPATSVSRQNGLWFLYFGLDRVRPDPPRPERHRDGDDARRRNRQRLQRRGQARCDRGGPHLPLSMSQEKDDARVSRARRIRRGSRPPVRGPSKG